jgi:hypothetical protein
VRARLILGEGPAVRVRLPPAGSPVRREKLIKIGAKVVTHGRYVTSQLAEVAVSRRMFADILALPPAPA